MQRQKREEKIKELEAKLQALSDQLSHAREHEDRVKLLHEKLEALSNKIESSETKVSNLKSKYAKAMI